ncbi:hypothetical protein NicSoilC12_30920 [Arthrobacter sp. NicSoilC12]|nr:hypothetical protein NicSoilC12_30920 [Arthrobacter sp. NicSoilC12]
MDESLAEPQRGPGPGCAEGPVNTPATPFWTRCPAPDAREFRIRHRLEAASAHDQSFVLGYPQFHAVVARHALQDRVGVAVRDINAENFVLHRAHGPDVPLRAHRPQADACGSCTSTVKAFAGRS